MTTTEKPKLAFGYNQGIPDNAKAAWGCRAIWHGTGWPDVVWDRQDADGDPDAKARLLDHLNMAVKDKWREAVECDHSVLGLDPARDWEAKVYEDDTVTILANTYRSYGYLYVVAFLREGVE